MADHKAINDVRRKINEVMKKTDERIVVGWRPSSNSDHKEGDVWVDNEGKKWTIKNGLRQTVTKLDDAKTPWFCPQCQKTMSHRFDIKFWRIRNKCMDCVIKEETEMRRLGTWEVYEKEKVKQNYLSTLRDELSRLEDLYKTVSAPEVIHADETRILMIEKWDVDIDKVKEDILGEIDKIKELIAKYESGETDGQKMD